MQKLINFCYHVDFPVYLVLIMLFLLSVFALTAKKNFPISFRAVIGSCVALIAIILILGACSDLARGQ